LLAAGVKVNARDPASKTALMAAAVNGYGETVKVLLAAGADVNLRDEHGETALMNAAFNGYVDILDLLVTAGADVNAARESGDTALMDAAWNGDIRVVNALLAAGAAVDARTLDGDTALMLASSKGHVDVVRSLLAMERTFTRRIGTVRRNRPGRGEGISTWCGCYSRPGDERECGSAGTTRTSAGHGDQGGSPVRGTMPLLLVAQRVRSRVRDRGRAPYR
jgi:hypothetical protein